MASSLIGALRVALGLDTAQFEAGAEKARQIARSKSSDMANSFNGAKRAVEGLLAAFTVAAIADQIKKSLEYAGSIAEVAQTLGVTTTQLQTYRYAATQSGVAQDQLEVGLRRLTVSIGKAELGSKQQATAFKALGISVDQLKGKNTGQVFELMANSLSKVTDRSQRAAVEMGLMGRSGSTLDNLLAPGAKRLNELADAAQRLGIVLSDAQIQGAEETAHKLEAVKQVLSAQIAGVVADNASAILSLSSALASLTGAIVRFLGSNPQLALGIIGALLGGRVGGIPGAILGGAIGALLGGKLQQNLDDTNTDPAFRKQQLNDARDRLIAARAASGGFRPAMSVAGIQTAGGAGPNIVDAQAEFDKQVKLANQAAAQINARAAALRSPQAGVDLPKFLSSPGRKKRAPKDLNEDVSFQFAQQERQTDLAILQARRQLQGTAEERAAIDLQMIKLEHDIQEAEINHKVEQAKKDFAEHKITKGTLDEVVAQSAILQQKNDELTQDKLKAFAEEQAKRKADALFEATDQQLKFQQDALHVADQLATTAADHRRIQLQILDAEYEQRRLQLEKNKLDAERNGATKEEIANIQGQIDQLPSQKAGDRSVILNSTRSPLAEFGSKIPQTMAQIRDAVENDAVNAISDFNDGLAEAIVNGKSLFDVLHAGALSFLQDLIKLAEQEAEMAIFKAVISAAGGAGGSFTSGGGGSSGLADYNPSHYGFAHGGSILVGNGPTPGFASGGSITVGGISGTDKNILSLNGMRLARVSYGERINISNDNNPSLPSPVQIVTHIDATGADPAQLARVRASIDQLHAELPGKIVATMHDARQRFIWR